MIDVTILGIETSCDETSVALCKNNVITDEITTSSMKLQSKFGGVVPELATRYHQKNIHIIFKELLVKNNIDIRNIDFVSYTKNPGLPGCLHVGECFARTLANLIDAKLLPINHLYGHIFSGFINKNIEIKYPFIGLVISGGHTTIYFVEDVDKITTLNETQDDAIGEVLDKIGRELGWGYPAGAKIDNVFNPKKIKVDLIKNYFNEKAKFSFSGIKTAALNYINNAKQKKMEFDPVEIASTVQKIMIDDVIKKMKYWIREKKCYRVCLGGGVSANKYLRTELQKLKIEELILPEMKYTGDQASMIAYYASLLITNAKTRQKQ